MKKIIIILFLLAQLFQNGISQSGFQLILSVKDSSKSFFSHDKVNISVPLRPTDSEGYEQPSIKSCYNLSPVQIKFPFTDWMLWDSSGKFEGWDSNPCDLRGDPIIYNLYINLLPLYNKKPEFLNAMKDGGLLEVRYKMYASIDGSPYDYIYSNIDTLYLPSANNADLQGLIYLTENLKDWSGFSYLKYLSWRDYPDGFLENMVNLFGNSLIGDLANYQLKNFDLSDKYRSGIISKDEIGTHQDLMYKEVLENCKSEMLKDYIIKIINLYK